MPIIIVPLKLCGTAFKSIDSAIIYVHTERTAPRHNHHIVDDVNAGVDAVNPFCKIVCTAPLKKLLQGRVSDGDNFVAVTLANVFLRCFYHYFPSRSSSSATLPKIISMKSLYCASTSPSTLRFAISSEEISTTRTEGAFERDA